MQTYIDSPMMTEELLKKYACGKADKAEKLAVRRYLAENFDLMFDVLEEMRRMTKQQLIEEAREELAQGQDAEVEKRLKALTGSDPVDELRKLMEQRHAASMSHYEAWMESATAFVHESRLAVSETPEHLLRSVLLRLLQEQE